MKIVEKPIDELVMYENNPRKNDEAVKYVADSIKEFGFNVPIVIDKNNVIVCGHTRLKAAKELKLSTVPCLIKDDLTDEQVKKFRLVDNKLAEIAEWDEILLKDELNEIDDLDFNDKYLFDDNPTDEDFLINENDDKPQERIENILKIGKIKVYMTDEEYNNLTSELDKYIEANSISVGFVHYLLNR